MRKIILLIVIVVSSCNCFSQRFEIPNSSFEKWNIFGFYENPDGWITNNNHLMEYVVKDSDAYVGNLAMRINANGFAQTQFPNFTQSSNNSYIHGILFHVKAHIQDSDQFTIKIFYLFNNAIYDSGQCVINKNINTYTYSGSFAKWLNSSIVDSIKIVIIGGTISNNYILIDDIWVDGLVNSINANKISKQPWKIFNLNQSLQFDPINSSIESDICIFSSTGQIVFSKMKCKQQFNITLNSGIYFYRIIQNNNAVQNGKVIVN